MKPHRRYRSTYVGAWVGKPGSVSEAEQERRSKKAIETRRVNKVKVTLPAFKLAPVSDKG